MKKSTSAAALALAAAVFISGCGSGDSGASFSSDAGESGASSGQSEAPLYSSSESSGEEGGTYFDGSEVSAYLDEEMHPFYAALTDSEKTVYEEILAGIEACAEEITLSEDYFGQYTLVNVVQYIAADHPQLFWYDGEAELVLDEKGSCVTAVRPKYNNLADDLEGNAQAIAEKVVPLLEAAEGLSDIEAQKYFYDYLCANITYLSGQYDQNIYSAFVEGQTVCAGYTKAMQYLMMMRSVPCYYATGWAYDINAEETVSHAWNIIRLNGNYYNCDVTFGDHYNEYNRFPSYISYEYYNIPDSQMADGQHSRDNFSMFLPECTMDDMSYSALYGRDWEADAASQIGTDISYVVDSPEAYANACSSVLAANGSGVSNFKFIASYEMIVQMADFPEEQYTNSIVMPAADSIGFYNWSQYYYNYSYTPLSGGDYYYVEYSLEWY